MYYKYVRLYVHDLQILIFKWSFFFCPQEEVNLVYWEIFPKRYWRGYSRFCPRYYIREGKCFNGLIKELTSMSHAGNVCDFSNGPRYNIASTMSERLSREHLLMWAFLNF